MVGIAGEQEHELMLPKHAVVALVAVMLLVVRMERDRAVMTDGFQANRHVPTSGRWSAGGKVRRRIMPR